jgi:hypothetical protein
MKGMVEALITYDIYMKGMNSAYETYDMYVKRMICMKVARP